MLFDTLSIKSSFYHFSLKTICRPPFRHGSPFSLFVFADHIFNQVSLSQRAMCHILSGHKESTSLFEAVVGLWHVEGLSGRGSHRPSRGDRLERKSGCKRSVAEEVAAAEIVWEDNIVVLQEAGGDLLRKANPRYFRRGWKKERREFERKNGKGERERNEGVFSWVVREISRKRRYPERGRQQEFFLVVKEELLVVRQMSFWSGGMTEDEVLV